MKINKESVLTVSLHTFSVECREKVYRVSITVNDKGRFTDSQIFESESGNEAADDAKEEILDFLLRVGVRPFKNKACNSRRVW